IRNRPSSSSDASSTAIAKMPGSRRKKTSTPHRTKQAHRSSAERSFNTPTLPSPASGGGKFQRWHEPFLRRSDGGSGRRERLLREVEAIGHVVGGLVARVDRRQAECLLAKLDEADVGVLGV